MTVPEIMAEVTTITRMHIHGFFLLWSTLTCKNEDFVILRQVIRQEVLITNDNGHTALRQCGIERYDSQSL